MVCSKIDDDIFTELFNYSNKLSYLFSNQDNEYYGSYGLSHVPGSITPELDVVDNIESNEDVNKNTLDFILNDNLPSTVEAFINKLQGPYSTGKVRFSKLMPDVTMPWHVDLNCENITRVHIPIITNNKSNYFYKDTNGIINSIHLTAKSVYALNVNYPHTIRNKGTTPRIHMIVNVNTNYENYIHYANTIEF
jgi:hypothetical protein